MIEKLRAVIIVSAYGIVPQQPAIAPGSRDHGDATMGMVPRICLFIAWANIRDELSDPLQCEVNAGVNVEVVDTCPFQMGQLS